ncbi:prepilin-type N-terminal cleavage/methylation domain-containing protein [Variovorax sp. H27-G14]|uniref:Tfp pilus assembly protein FimT/FimU n=1 Tax=Variovorax sp. H27-G14 TaxID=3111914 RepID=UPI0038FC2025
MRRFPNEFLQGWRTRSGGFTLIEMMAVMVLIALLSAVVLPSFQRWFDGLDSRVQATELASRLQRLYSRTALLGQGFVLTKKSAGEPLADRNAAFLLPSGWSMADDTAIVFSGAGVCAPAVLKLRSSASQVTLRVAEATCEVSIERGG